MRLRSRGGRRHLIVGQPKRRDQRDVAGGDQDAVAAVGKVDPRAAAGHKPAGCGAKSLQALQPDRAVRAQAAGKPRDLPAVPVARTKGLFGKGCDIGGAEQAEAGRIGPQDPRAVSGPQPGGQPARRIGGQSRIVRGQKLNFRILHRNHVTVRHRELADGLPTALSDRYYRKRVAAGPRPDGAGGHLSHG